jgi:hypothetical protein
MIMLMLLMLLLMTLQGHGGKADDDKVPAHGMSGLGSRVLERETRPSSGPDTRVQHGRRNQSGTAGMRTTWKLKVPGEGGRLGRNQSSDDVPSLCVCRMGRVRVSINLQTVFFLISPFGRAVPVLESYLSSAARRVPELAGLFQFAPPPESPQSTHPRHLRGGHLDGRFPSWCPLSHRSSRAIVQILPVPGAASAAAARFRIAALDLLLPATVISASKSTGFGELLLFRSAIHRPLKEARTVVILVPPPATGLIQTTFVA